MHPTKISRRGVVGASLAGLAAPALIGGSAPPAAAAAAFLGVFQPPYRRFRLGAFEITVVSDGGAMIDGPWPIVGEDRPRPEVEALMRENLLPEARFRPGFSPVLINTGRAVVMIDAGNGADGFMPRPAAGRLMESLAAAGVAPDQIDVVALTHGHVDHVGGLTENGRPGFPNARYAIGETEARYWNDEARLAAPEGSIELKSARLYRKAVAPLAERTTFLRPGDEVVPGVVAVAAFGHTPGHLAYRVQSGGRALLVWGDCAHHEVASLAHPEWSAFFDHDKEQGKATRRRIYEMAASERLPVLGYHTSFPSLGMIEQRGGGAYRWLPVTYQFEA